MGMKFLEQNLLDHIQRPEFQDLRSALRTRKYSGRTIIFHPHETENLIFIVASGRVRIYLAFEEKEFTIGILNKGDIYSTHSGTFVESLEDATLLLTDVQTFRRRMASVPEVTKTMVRVLGNALRNSFAIIEGLVFKDANRRLIALLATEARRHGRAENGGILVDIDLPVEQVASLVGVSRQTVSTLINDLVRAGLLKRPARGQYLIPNLDALDEAGSLTAPR